MNKFLLKTTMIIALAFAMTACSKKTTPPQSDSPMSRNENGPRQGGPPQYAQLLAQMDSNKDGKLAKTEVKGRLQQEFAKVDKDQDGFISKTEFESAPKGRRPSKS
jgi:Ca2+-binding EF-hand superfamily protein